MNRKHGHQMSDSLIIMILLNLSGGTQDACSYFLRDHVFANAQTGNIVLMGCYLISEDLRDSIRYFLPVFCFALGVLTACFIRSKCRHTGKIHWRHLVLVMEILLLFVVGFLPPQVNWLANALTSFAIGAACGGHLTTYFSYRTIWISCGILILCFLLMLIEEEEDLEVLEKKERKELQAEKNLVKKEQEKLQEEKLLMKETENEFQQKISKG